MQGTKGKKVDCRKWKLNAETEGTKGEGRFGSEVGEGRQDSRKVR